MRYYVALHPTGYTVRERPVTDIGPVGPGREVLRFPVDPAIADGVNRAWTDARAYVNVLNRRPG